MKKPRGGSFYHKFSKEDCSKGGKKARDIEQARGTPLNHGILWGKKRKNDNSRDF